MKTLDQIIKDMLGELLFDKAALMAQIHTLRAENARLDAQIAKDQPAEPEPPKES